MKDVLIPFAGALATAVGGVLVAWVLARVGSGRFARTLDQANKLIDFVERCCAAHDGLAKITGTNRNDVEKPILDAIQAVQQDFAAERAALPEFKHATSSARRAMLLYLPNGTYIWLPFLLFHTLLLFMLYVVVVRTLNREWTLIDVAVLLIAGLCAALARVAVRLIPTAP